MSCGEEQGRRCCKFYFRSNLSYFIKINKNKTLNKGGRRFLAIFMREYTSTFDQWISVMIYSNVLRLVHVINIVKIIF